MVKIPLSQIVKDYMSGKGLDSLHGFPKYLNSAIRGLKSIHQDLLAKKQYCQLSITTAYTAELPADCVKVAGVAKLVNGMFLPLNSNNDLPPVATDSSGDEVGPTNTGGDGFVGFYNTVLHNNHGQSIGRIYGLSGRQNGEYVINEPLNRVEFGSGLDTSYPIYLMYYGSPQKVDGKYMVPPAVAEALLAYIYWNDIRFKSHRTVPGSEKERAKDEYAALKIKAATSLFSYTRADAENVARRGMKMSKQ